MIRPPTDQDKLFRIAAVCQEAVQSQNQRAARNGYGLDDYTEGRTVGAANLARKILRVLAGGQGEGDGQRGRVRQPVGQ